jgi:hypothetical protein
MNKQKKGYIVDKRTEPISHLPPMMLITEVITDKDYYPLPADCGHVIYIDKDDKRNGY